MEQQPLCKKKRKTCQNEFENKQMKTFDKINNCKNSHLAKHTLAESHLQKKINRW
jgi:hypothetical protein